MEGRSETEAMFALGKSVCRLALLLFMCTYCTPAGSPLLAKGGSTVGSPLFQQSLFFLLWHLHSCTRCVLNSIVQATCIIKVGCFKAKTHMGSSLSSRMSAHSHCFQFVLALSHFMSIFSVDDGIS